MEIETQRPTVARIDLNGLAQNLHSIQNFIGEGVRIMGVVKANAYGHGAVECSRRLEAEGVDWLGVATVEEAVELREAGINSPILCFGSFWPGQEQILFDHDITAAVFDLERAALLNSKALQLKTPKNVHIKIDTGMGRVGVPFRDVAEWAEEFRRFENLHVEGLMTHFAAADDLSDEYTNVQMRRFAEAVSAFHEKGFRPTILDMANSPGAVAHNDSRATMIRVGGILYGLGDDVLPKGVAKPNLQPVMSLHAEIAFIKTVPAGESIGYGRTFVTTRESMIATLPIGYHDGLSRSLSNIGRVIVNGHYAPIVGRISMDWTTVDVTDVHGVGAGDTVTLIGAQGGATIKAESIAAEIATISYEVTCSIDPRVRRVYVS
ncbi:MAG TPA: alanine racemase [Pyrinomonadaceae bacterium]|nr:alanine racemase [Pyrinomonadaceae bacterium]